MFNAIEIEIKRSERTGKSRVKVVMDNFWATYDYDYSVSHSKFVEFYTEKFISAVNERNKLGLKTDNAKAAVTRNGWVVIL